MGGTQKARHDQVDRSCHWLMATTEPNGENCQIGVTVVSVNGKFTIYWHLTKGINPFIEVSQFLSFTKRINHSGTTHYYPRVLPHPL
uniref:Uncharacterized protein n=1 Tax=Anguilla anguilla TaxID=7936 RepID=A0A0E9QU80_ANGAN